jgi:ketopantoate hydroxymethyltransferase
MNLVPVFIKEVYGLIRRMTTAIGQYVADVKSCGFSK